MKKLLLFPSLSFLTFGAIAQPTIQSSDFYPTVGESFVLNYGNYVNPGSGGSNVTWDLSGMSATSTVNVNALTADPSFAGATINLEYVGQSNIHANLTPTEFLIVGESTSSAAINYTNSKKMYQFPMTNGTSYTDNFTGNVSTSGITLSRTGSVTSTVDGYGTLITPSGTYTNVLRVHSVHTSTDTYMGQSSTGTIDMYSWIKAGFHMELAVVQEITTDFGSQQVGWYATSTVGVAETDFSQLKVYPNPTRDILKIDFESMVDHVEVSDVNGRLIEVSFDKGNRMLDLSQLNAGIYYVSIQSNNSKTVRKIVKQ